MSSITIDTVRKSYGHHTVLHEISLSIENGEFIVLVGPSGCGKSTLLRMIAGLEDVTDGEIKIGGTRVNDLAPKNRNIAMVFQSYALYPHMSVADNMSYSLKLRKRPKEAIVSAVVNAAEVLGLKALLDRRPKALSGGQRQRVAMGRAIVREPAAFLFDEPLSNLDARLREQMRSEIKRLHKELKATSVYVTHDQIEAMTLADRIVAMNEGKVQQVGSPLDLYRQPANLFVASFIGSPGMNFMEATYSSDEGGRVTLKDGTALHIQKSLPRQSETKLIVGIRPENVVLDQQADLEVDVDLVEPTGLGFILHLKLHDAPFKIFIRDEIIPDAPSKLRVKLLPQHLHFFGEDGQRIG
ncbi:sn-glycerol-3-phosphate ABC transporter ATP-binding protein UgpC [Rhizobium sp. ICMP 5592]|uniref:ABC transporter ATP-binding protein n=1 Tax=Rhizobium sp. ICMP 5592 TaxID=2292445 RepID=UPI001296C324|nr:sn-glycerol-3-phosphate ABC transporter ATP-binding protein UgpC [Rhizobium sp. ICMP 5592]MQB46262.1 sn-glycerol-3-phosphate ABC transporter ATP-binding protein UgpC [Rhizobium sp. ICMP 5592]